MEYVDHQPQEGTSRTNNKIQLTLEIRSEQKMLERSAVFARDLLVSCIIFEMKLGA